MAEAIHVAEQDVHLLLERMRIPHSCNGYSYLVQAILLVCQDKELRDSRRVMPVYERVGELEQVKGARVERSIRTAANAKHARCSMTNGQLIYWAADTLCSSSTQA